MNELENKYIELLLKRCINFEKSKSLFINYQVESEFIEKVVDKAKEMGIEDIYLSFEDTYKEHEILSHISLEQIDTYPFFDNSIWDEYAKKDASFLILETEIPGLMDDIDPEKLSRARYIKRTTKPIYKDKQLKSLIPWCIACIPDVVWAKNLFPGLNEEDAYNKLFECIMSMCMVDTKDPIESWNNFLRKQQTMVEKLNNLEISKLHYTNSLGTNLTIELNEDALWTSAGNHGENMIVNMPSYEIFTTPDFNKTNGIVYSSKPLLYNGALIDNFYIEFKDGKVEGYDAKIGKEILKGIIESDEYSSYLGEVALIEHNSPISNTGLVFKTTLIDENSSCHLALGCGFNDCIKNSKNLNNEELLNKGVNPSKNHVDFMIGTYDLNIEAETNKGKVLILKNGNFNI